jgi:hypothetical protein
MWRVLAVSLVAALIPRMVAAGPPSGLAEYMRPAQITRLDWLLLTAKVESFSGHIKWDESQLVKSVSLFAIHERALVGMTFLVDKERFIDVPNDTASRVFTDVVLQAARVLGVSIPEVRDGSNVYANFVVESGEVIAEYANRRVALKRRALLTE